MSATKIDTVTVDGVGQVHLALSRREAAASLGMSLTHFQRHVQGHVPCVYSGTLRLYPVNGLNEWLSSHACGGKG